jgi:hypothetical protein
MLFDITFCDRCVYLPNEFQQRSLLQVQIKQYFQCGPLMHECWSYVGPLYESKLEYIQENESSHLGELVAQQLNIAVVECNYMENYTLESYTGHRREYFKLLSNITWRILLSFSPGDFLSENGKVLAKNNSYPC